MYQQHKIRHLLADIDCIFRSTQVHFNVGLQGRFQFEWCCHVKHDVRFFDHYRKMLLAQPEIFLPDITENWENLFEDFGLLLINSLKHLWSERGKSDSVQILQSLSMRIYVQNSHSKILNRDLCNVWSVSSFLNHAYSAQKANCK